MTRTRLYIIRTVLMMLLLLVGGMANEAWAVEVTYHVITLPFSNASTNNIPYRIEAIKKTVTQNTTDEIKLPLELKSPLMKYESYSYYTDVTKTGPTKIFPHNNSTFYTYDFTGKTPLAAGTKVSDLGANTDVYVTYVWDDDHDYLKDDYGKTLDLTGNKTYNIEFRTNDGNWFYALNMNPERGNRGQAIPSGQVRKLADLCSDDPVTIIGTVQNRNIFYFKWKLTNNDPYNIILQTAHDSNDFIYKEDGYWKTNKDALFYGSLSNASTIRTNWVTNEINKAYQGKSSVDSIPLTGWYRGVDPSPYGRASRDNGVLDNLYFSFTLLAHPIASYTLAASWVNVNEHDWVPNKSGQYLLMQHTPEGLPYAGPKFMDLSAADQIRFHEVRDYIYKVQAPITKTILSANFEWSDYGRDSLLIDYVPEAMKRKYTRITGTYANSDLTLERATFQDLYEHEDPDIKEIRDVWLKYSVQPSIPFEAASTSAAFADLKWYNIFVNKEENYITWYDTSTSGEPPTPLNQFSTSEGASAHSKYGHDAHFAFIGDPYELKVVNRQASEKVDPAVIEYLKQGTSTTDNLISGADDTYYYKPVPKGTALTVGNKYYTSDSGAGEFTYKGQVANGSNYFEKYIHYSAVTYGTTLTRGITYYTSSTGGGAFISNGTEVANGTNYYEAKGSYVAVPNETTLTIGKTYYTSSSGGGAFASNGNEVSNGSNYYEYDEGDYIAVPSGTRLTIGRTYYTTSAGAGKFIAEYEKANENQYWEKIPKSDWEIIFDNNTGLYAGCFRLRQFNTYDSPVTIGWDSSGKRPLNGDGSGGSTMARLSVLELPLMYYYYYIVDTSGRIAVMAKEEQITGTTLNYEAIPDVIRSPFLALGDADRLTFKTYSSADMATLTETAGIGMTVNLSSAAFTTITSTNSVEANEYQNHIFVSYDTSKLTAMNEAGGTPLKDVDNDNYYFNVILNNEYIYYDSGTIKSKANFDGEGDSPGHSENLWVLGGEDPYAMIIRNRGAGAYDAASDKYVKVTDWEIGTITWVQDPADATRFIVKSSTSEGSYEVMATTSVAKDGSTNKIDVATSVDASTTYYNIGRVVEEGNIVVKMFDDETYAHGYAQIRFQLKKSSAKQVTYHLIDIARKELLTESARHTIEDKPIIPPEIFSPLVGYPNYTYWQSASTDEKKIVTCSDDYAGKKFSDIYSLSDWDKNSIDIWITYIANDLVDMNHTTMYLLKYEQGDMFRQENGSDGLLDDPSSFTGTDAEKKALYQAVYPYCNGDGNFFVYGENQYELQQEGAASTRTRWAWYVQSSNHDPYHVKILSRQTETYDGLERSGYFATRKFEGYDEVVTSLVWPNISGVLATDYMVLGNVGQYQLVTTPVDENDDGDYADEGEDPRHVVNSFEQYWKTYDTVKKKLLSDLLPSCEERERTDRTDGSIEVPTSPASLRERLTGTGEGQYNFHSYQKMAKAKRWNGYNAAGEKSKGWESLEHWFQTVNMGSGYFDLIPTTIDPALILLDQHGWEIMRKPLPSSPDDPTKAHKYEVLGAYNSPMVKEYIFWASASKRSGFHQYYKLDKRIGGSDFSSTSLTNLPPYGTENVMDNKGNLNDQYVTYIVKEEYAVSYNPSTKVGAEFLISQGDDLAKKNEPDHKLTVGSNPGSTSQYIIDHIETPGLSDELWYVKPNVDIDTEMGYTASNHAWGDTNPNAYEDATYGTNQVAGIISNADDITKYGRFSFSNGFDPYNIQISSVGSNTQYFTMGMTGAEVSEGGMVGKYGSKTVTLADKNTSPVTGNGYDNSKWAMTNQTFMAVQDAEGNMQLMPRFDHNLRMQNFVSLVTPTAEAGDEDKLKKTYTLLYRPFVYNYRIIDNEGRESLRYQSGGDLVPQTPDHFKSPLAKDFKYYKGLTETAGVYRLTNIANNEITGSLAGAGLTTPSVTDENIVFVRYTYDKEADAQHILLGKWLTMKLNEKDVQYTTVSENKGIYADAATPTKPATIDNSAKTWQWKFLKNPYLAPDPYAVQLFNRNQKDMPMGSSKLDGTVAVTADASPNQYFALLSHTSNGYALAVARTKEFNNYYFLQGIGTDGTIISTSNAASVRQESGFTGATCSFSDMKSQILLTDDVENTYTYKVYTNGGVEAISDTQTQYEAADNDFVPRLPEAIKTPLLNFDQFRYYEALTDTAYNSGKTIPNLYGLYDGEVYVRYNAYNPRVSEYKVPNERNTPGTTVAKGDKSNDASLRLDGKLPYNIIWYNDNMMKAGKVEDVYSTIIDGGSQSLKNEVDYLWTFAGNDPYAIEIQHKSSEKYVHENSTTTCSTCGGTGLVSTETCSTCHGSKSIITSDLNASPTTFMLLNRDGYEYGVFAETSHKEKMLTEYGNELTATDRNSTKFIIFSLGTNRVIYHLVLENIGEYQDIPYRHRNTGEITDPKYKTDAEGGRWNSVDGYYEDVWQSTDTIRVHGTTKRDLTNNAYNLGDDGGLFYPEWDGTISSTVKTLYCKNVGPISLGDELKVPSEFYRPNVNYFFVVRDIHDEGGTVNTSLNTKYKGLQLNSKEMSLNEALIGKIVYIDIIYRFNTDLESNSGDDFVKSIDQNKWYTVETVIGGKTYLAQYTNAWGFELKEGRGSHYTNDFLWTPIGDPYGFQLVNRYMDVNSGDHNLGEKNRAITTIPYKTVIPKTNPVTDVATSAFENGKQIVMGNYEDAGQRVVVPGGVTRTTVATKVNLGDITPDDIKTNSIYELLEPSNPDNAGYFRFHPVANTSEQPQVYFNPEWADDNGDDTNEYLIRLKTSAADFTFGLSAELMKPYFDRAGYVGGLTKDVYNTPANATLVAAMKADNPVLTAAQLMQVQDLVYNPANIVQLSETGYYRLHSPLGISGIDPARYVSGYTHKIELTCGEGNKPIPMHFYEKNSAEVRQFTDFKDGGFTYSPATRGDLTILPVERDPASIFYFEKTTDYPDAVTKDADKARYNLGTISTEGLYIKGEKGQVTITGTPPALDNLDDPNIEATGERPAAVMTATKDAATQLFVMDIGGGILLIHDNVTALGRQYLKYLSYDYSNDEQYNENTIYDMKLTNHTHTDHAKFCMQPVQKTETKGINEMGLKLNLNKGGDGYYYASFCAPYDVLLTDKDNDAAYICKVWDTEMLHLKKVGKYNTVADGCRAEYAGSDQFVPAGTPVIIRSKNTSVTMALPTKEPSTTLANNYKPEEGKACNIFSGVYLEQLLYEQETGSNDVYVFGLPYKGTATKHGSYYDENSDYNGQITISLPQHEETGIGFYINANYNRESKADMGSWLRNNRYVYNNKVYYRTPGGGGAAAPRRNAPTPDFIPVVFDDEDEPIDDNLSQQQRYDGRVYDLQGRCVASKQQVDDGSWKQHVHPGIYILNGRKFRK